MAAFIAELLAGDDATLAVTGVQVAYTLMEKLPDIFRLYFMREVCVGHVCFQGGSYVFSYICHKASLWLGPHSGIFYAFSSSLFHPSVARKFLAFSSRLKCMHWRTSLQGVVHEMMRLSTMEVPDTALPHALEAFLKARQAGAPATTSTPTPTPAPAVANSADDKGKAVATEVPVGEPEGKGKDPVGEDAAAPAKPDVTAAPAPATSSSVTRTAPQGVPGATLSYTDIEQLRSLAARMPEHMAKKWLVEQAGAFIAGYFGEEGGDGVMSDLLQKLTEV